MAPLSKPVRVLVVPCKATNVRRDGTSSGSARTKGIANTVLFFNCDEYHEAYRRGGPETGFASCECRDSNNEGPINDPGIGGLHYTYCPAYTMTLAEETAWRGQRSRTT